MTPLNERLDDVGCNEKDDWREHTHVIFKWMQQATAEIDRLTAQIEQLKERDEIQSLVMQRMIQLLNLPNVDVPR